MTIKHLVAERTFGEDYSDRRTGGKLACRLLHSRAKAPRMRWADLQPDDVRGLRNERNARKRAYSTGFD